MPDYRIEPESQDVFHPNGASIERTSPLDLWRRLTQQARDGAAVHHRSLLRALLANGNTRIRAHLSTPHLPVLPRPARPELAMALRLHGVEPNGRPDVWLTSPRVYANAGDLFLYVLDHEDTDGEHWTCVTNNAWTLLPGRDLYEQLTWLHDRADRHDTQVDADSHAGLRNRIATARPAWVETYFKEKA